MLKTVHSFHITTYLASLALINIFFIPLNLGVTHVTFSVK